MTDAEQRQSRGLAGKYFAASEIFAEESQRIFAKSWICIGHDSDFPAGPSATVVEIDGQSIVVVRKPDGDFRAFHNVCRHRGTRLCHESTSRLSHPVLTCPYHAWTYDLDGKLVGAPNMHDAAHFSRAEFPLQPVAVQLWHGFVMAHLNAAAGTPVTAFAPLEDRLGNWLRTPTRCAEKLRYHVRANWKLLFQNYSECYHCPTVHPDLNRLTPYKLATNDLTSGPILGGPMELQAEYQTVSSDGKLVASPFPKLTQQQRRGVYYYTVFPALFVSAHPDYVMVHRLVRRQVDATEVVCYFLVRADIEPRQPDDLSRATRLWDAVNRQDWHVCELTQAGSSSPAFQPGPYSPLESMVRAFDDYYLRVMQPGA